jgi:hypothetical protein
MGTSTASILAAAYYFNHSRSIRAPRERFFSVRTTAWKYINQIRYTIRAGLSDFYDAKGLFLKL